MPFRRCLFRFLNHFYVFQCWSAAVNVPHEYSLFKILFMVLFKFWPMISWTHSIYLLVDGRPHITNYIIPYFRIELLFFFCFMPVIHQDIGQWQLAGNSKGCGFSEYILCLRFMHIKVGPVILLVLIIITVFLINCFFCSFQKLIVELYKEVRLKSSSISLSLGCFKADASFSSAHIFV
jgi:hypothetical protein